MMQHTVYVTSHVLLHASHVITMMSTAIILHYKAGEATLHQDLDFSLFL